MRSLADTRQWIAGGARRLAVALLLALAATVAAPGGVAAQELPEGVEVPAAVKRRVAVLPLELPLFLELERREEAAAVLPLDAEALETVIRGHLRRHPYLELATEDEVREALRSDRDTAVALEKARQRLGYGQQHFFGFNLDAAVRELEEARSHFEAGFGEVLEPSGYADALQYLAFSLLDRSAERAGTPAANDDLVAAQDAMREMVRVAPYIVLDRARQPAERVDLYLEARRSLLANRALRRPDVVRAALLAERLGTDYVLFARLVELDDGSQRWHAELDIYDAAAADFVDGDDHDDPILLSPQPEAAADQVDARLSRFTACVEPGALPPEPGPGEAGRVYLDLGFAYFVFLESPTRSPFDNLGATVALTYMFTDYLSLAARFSVSVSGEDAKRDLQSTFNTIRADVAMGLSVPLRWVRPFLALGIEVAKPTSFWTTRDRDCKAFGRDDPAGGCLADAVFDYDVELLGGLFASAGANINLGVEPLFLTAVTHFAFYVFPLDIGKELNFPVGFDLGLEYRF